LSREKLALSTDRLAHSPGGLPMTKRTYRFDEITRLTGLTARTVRYYIEQSLIPGPEPRGIATMYSHEQLVRLKAIVYLRKTERLRLDAIRRRFAKMSLADIEALVAPPPPPAAVPAPAAAGLPFAYARWDYIELIPGLELRVRSDAGAVLKRLAQEIHARYGAKARDGESAGAEDGGGNPTQVEVT
jgi:DNA-binding transcriptional MerR regulator